MAEKGTQNNQTGNGTSKKRIRIMLIGGAFVALLAIIGVLLYIVLKPKPVESNVITKDKVEMMETAAQDLQQKVQEGMFQMTMNNQWVFPDSSSPSTNAYVSNSTNNRRAFYFDVILNDTQEVVYSSPILPVGSKLEGFTLDKELEMGSYDAVVQYNLLDDDDVVVSSLGAAITLTIEN